MQCNRTFVFFNILYVYLITASLVYISSLKVILFPFVTFTVT